MSSSSSKSIHVFAPAKLNLNLHVTGKLDSGYHTLDSLISFADIGDNILIEPSSDFEFQIDGPFSKHFRGRDLETDETATNLVVRAARGLAELTDKALELKTTLTKNLPLGGGIGGGSADAAAVIWGLLEFWDLSREPGAIKGLDSLLLSLGADVPICFACQSARIQGIGEIIDPVHSFPEVPIVLVYPGKPCETARIFGDYGGRLVEPLDLPQFETPQDLYKFMLESENMVSNAALRAVPEIQNALNALSAQAGCKFTRMSGSGSTCFGIFEGEDQAQDAAREMA
ncbi:MAG: 4-(cytidine 5'-diphospho)-2-C-methyl-D-erythritol kinase, partial [Pseudomonadota bacterium]